MASRVPMEILFEIIEQVAVVERPLAYAYPAPTLQTLLSFAILCKATHRFTTPILYSRMCIDSAAQLRRVMQANPHNLKNVLCLYIRFTDFENDLDKDTELAGMTRVLKPTNSLIRAAMLREIVEPLAYLLQRIRMTVERLALTLPAQWDSNHLGLSIEEIEAQTYLWRELLRILYGVVRNLTEFIFPRCSLNLGELITSPLKHWDCLRRINLGGIIPSIMLTSPEFGSLESVCIVGQHFDSGFVQGGLTAGLNHTLRRTLAFYKRRERWAGGPSTEWSCRIIEEYLRELERMNAVTCAPVEAVIVRMPESCEIRLETVKMAREGMLWDIGDMAAHEAADKLGVISVSRGTVAAGVHYMPGM